MKIQLDTKDWPDVFDHPEYCNGARYCCQFLDDETWECKLFDRLDAFAPGKYLKFKKHHECKTAYQKAKHC